MQVFHFLWRYFPSRPDVIWQTDTNKSEKFRSSLLYFSLSLSFSPWNSPTQDPVSYVGAMHGDASYASHADPPIVVWSRISETRDRTSMKSRWFAATPGWTLSGLLIVADNNREWISVTLTYLRTSSARGEGGWWWVLKRAKAEES